MLEVKKFTQKTTLLLFIVAMIARVSGWLTIVSLRLRLWRRCTALDNFIQLSTIQPNPAALGAIVYFYTLAIGHHEILINT